MQDTMKANTHVFELNVLVQLFVLLLMTIITEFFLSSQCIPYVLITNKKNYVPLTLSMPRGG